jgi:serine/threonine protein kinase
MRASPGARVRTGSWHPTSTAPLPAVESYQLGARIDDGGTNELYEASHPSFPGPVVVKLLLRAVAAGPVASDACLAEVAEVARLGHPNVAAVVAIGRRPDGLPFLVRESLKGETLEAFLARRGRVSAGEASAIVSGIAAALAAAHGARVIHGELRPSKVFLAQAAGYAGGFVKLLDFGVWRLAGERHGPGARADVARFTAPELLDGGKVDPRTDEFALAAMTYRMIAGNDAFPGDDVAAVMSAVSRGNAAPLRATVRCTPAVGDVIRRGLARRRADRFGTVLAFASALESVAIPRRETPEETQAVSTWQLLSSAPAPGPRPRRSMDEQSDLFVDGPALSPAPIRRRRSWLLMIPVAVAVATAIAATGWLPPDWLSSITALVTRLSGN